ncbi:ATP-dependent carboxylate-amine ligase domain protein, ATP-grasp (fragment) [Candidatus Sulfopaludibacter sp. SbA4]
MTILCIASYEKGHEFLRESKRQGSTVVLLTSLSLRDKAQWPLESIDEVFYMPDDHHHWDLPQTLNAVSYLARTRDFERIVPLDDFDVEVAAALREHLRVPGMGETTARRCASTCACREWARPRPTTFATSWPCG